MKKNPNLFDVENEARKRIEFSGRKLPEVKVGEIWWYYVGVNIGQEISRESPYMRPCIILHTFSGSSLIHIIPLSSKLPTLCKKRYKPFYKFEFYGLKKSYLMLHQCRTIDKKRLIKFQSTRIISKGLIDFIIHNKI